MENIIEIPEPLLLSAIAEVAASSKPTARHPEWIKRRLREAIDFISKHDRSNPHWSAHWNLAEPVLVAVGNLSGGSLRELRAGAVH